MWLPLLANLQKGLENRLLELLRLQRPPEKLLTRRPLAPSSGVPFYFFAPKVGNGFETARAGAGCFAASTVDQSDSTVAQ